MFETLTEKICNPPLLAECDQFLIKIADGSDEIEQAQRLRYEVFNIEQGKGLQSAMLEKLDRDEFDDYCFHLIVVEKKTNKIVGTYRMHPGSVANQGIGLYSAREYKIDGLEHVIEDAIEVGRSCVSPEYRNGTVVALLWSGLAAVLSRSGLRYLIGCVSLEDTAPATGWALYEYFKGKNYLSALLQASPLPGYTLEHPGNSEISALLEDGRSLLLSIPPLFKGYLRLGVGICGEPAWDQEFKSIDFLILLDCKKIPEKYARHFFS
ncbi:MAG: GNAT family N-acyltransferase [Victivallaceae bacterium]